MKNDILGVGIAGLGGAGQKILPGFENLKGVELVAAADSRPAARKAFEVDYNLPAFPTVAAMCHAAPIDAVYIATPSFLHSEHTIEAVQAGKHVMCEKPLATCLEDCDRMIAAAQQAGVLLLQGHSKVFEAPVRAIRELIVSGRLGRAFQLDTWNFNDWMRRPRLEAELQTEVGGGVVFRQAPQQIDIARYLLGSMPRSIRAVTGQRAAGLCTEGNYSAIITFDEGAAATLSFNGYGYFDIQEIAIGSPLHSFPQDLRSAPVSSEEKYRNRVGGLGAVGSDRPLQPFCGLTIVSCEGGIIRQSPEGLYVYTDHGREEIPVPEDTGRVSGLIELRNGIRENRSVFPDGTWARDTLRVCLAILESSRQGREIFFGPQSRDSELCP